MSKQLPEKAVLAFKKIDEKIKALYAKRDEMVLKAMENFETDGVSQGVTKIEGEDKPYCRVRITDTLEQFQTGAPVFTNAKFSRYRVEISMLKNEPK